MVSPIKIRGLHDIQPSNERFFFLDQCCYCNDNFDYTRKIDWNNYQCNDCKAANAIEQANKQKSSWPANYIHGIMQADRIPNLSSLLAGAIFYAVLS